MINFENIEPRKKALIRIVARITRAISIFYLLMYMLLVFGSDRLSIGVLLLNIGLLGITTKIIKSLSGEYL